MEGKPRVTSAGTLRAMPDLISEYLFTVVQYIYVLISFPLAPFCYACYLYTLLSTIYLYSMPTISILTNYLPITNTVPLTSMALRPAWPLSVGMGISR